MKNITLSEANADFEAIADMARHEPVIIMKNKRSLGVFLSMKAYEDRLWGEAAMVASQEGYLTPEESRKLLDELAHAGS